MRSWGRLAVLGVGFWASHLLGYLFQSPVYRVSPVWPASGVGLAVMLLVPRAERGRALALLGAVTLLSNLLMSGSWPMSVGFAAANVVEFWGGLWLMRAGRESPVSIHTVSGVLRFAFIATLWTAIPALLGAATAHLGAGAPIARTYTTWWIGDALGVLLVTPLVLCWARPEPALRATRSVEALTLAVAWALAAWLTFRPAPQSWVSLQPYMLLPLLAWTALRLGGRGVTTALVALAAAAILSTHGDRAVLAGGLEVWLNRLFTVQVYVAVAAVQSLLLAASTTTTKLMERAAREDQSRVQRAEEEARSTAESLRFALDAAHMGTWEWNVESGRVIWSERVAAIFGLSDGEFNGTYAAYLALVHPEDRSALLRAIDGALRGENNDEYRVEHRVLRPNGPVAWIEGKGSVRRDAQGRPQRMLGTVVEITARKQAEAELLTSEQLLRHFIRHAPAAVAMFDTQMRYLQVAERWVSDYRLDGQHLIGRSHYEIFPDVPERWKEIHRRVLAGSVERCDEDPFERADGTLEWLQWEIRPWRRASGDIGGLIMFTQVITERKRAEEAQRLIHDQLRQTQKLEALGTLAGGIAHDFNNILGGMLAYTELASMENRDRPELLGHLREVTLAGQRATGLVGQILSFSRQQRQERKPVALGRVADEALQLLRSTLPSSIQILVSVPGPLPSVLADATQMHQVVMNLCTNAAHAMNGRGRLSLTLDVASTPVRQGGASRPGPSVRLVVEDTGHGMDASTVSRIFEPFFTTKQPGDGTGLGLAVVHGIVNDHGGSITVASEPGRGTAFTVLLPQAEAPAASLEPVATEAPRGRGERILLVDDERILCEVARRFLLRAGYQADTCLAAEDAWNRVQREPEAYAAVVSDLTMPGMSGLDLAARIHSVRPDLPVLLTSGHAAGLTTEMLAELGVCELLQKPVDHAGLTRAVARAVNRSST